LVEIIPIKLAKSGLLTNNEKNHLKKACTIIIMFKIYNED